MHPRTHTHTHAPTHAHTHTNTHTNKHTRTHKQTHTHIHTHTRARTHTYTHMHITYDIQRLYLKTYLEFLAGQSDSSDDPLGIIVNGAADKGAPNSGSLKSI